MEACKNLLDRLAKEGISLGVEDLCKLGYLVAKSVRVLTDKLGAPIKSLDTLEIDFEGPRIIARITNDNMQVYVDVSPDGVEEVISLQVKGYKISPQLIEEELSRIIEEHDEFQGVEEYDVSVADKYITITLVAKLLEDLPDLGTVRRILGEVLEGL